jgi:putative ABC transport system substrate-binding protein
VPGPRERCSEPDRSIQESFAAVWGDRAATRWVEEHNAFLAAGRPSRVWRIGYLTDTLSSQAAAPNTATSGGGALIRELAALGYTPGRDLVFEWRFTEGRQDALPGLAAELVNMKVDLIYAALTREPLAAKALTSTIPIITPNFSGDPVQLGLVASMQKPGGNVTAILGLPEGEVYAKRLAVLQETVPGLERVAVLRNPTAPTAEALFAELRDNAVGLGLQLQAVDARNAQELAGAFDAAKGGGAQAIITLSDSLFTANRVRLGELAIQQQIPMMHQGIPAVREGGLMTYAVRDGLGAHLAAGYVDRILKGTSPGDLPVIVPNEFDLVINIKAAAAIGLTVPEPVLSQATLVIR